MTPDPAFAALGIALGLGLLVGLQRERVAVHFAGVRTFPLIAVMGAVCAMLADRFGGWILGAGLAGVITTSVLGNVFGPRRAEEETGVTTEMAMLVVFLVGALAWTGPTSVAVVVGGGVAVLLHAKAALHGFVRRLGEKDTRAIFQFALLSLVILPVLPDRAFGPEPIDVLNPRQIWLMVVLVVGISLGGYAAYKALGARAGAALSGLLGGLISSTATTVSYARRSAEAPTLAATAAMVVMLASTVVYGRVLVEVAVVARPLLGQIAPPLLALGGVSALLSALMWLVARRQPSELPEQANPTELKSALAFGAMFAVVLVAVAAGRHFFGRGGLFVVAALSGMTDMDAITLSTANMIAEDRLDASTGWRVILVAAMANLVFKGAAVAALGSPALRRAIAVAFGFILIAATGVLVLWPG
ncbi:MAG TPA: MgtC/SapB family protein [Phycisphaerales bacterium]|nr:MgtC/SapB family protein [Phycisphaerales bacterium]